MWHKTKIASDWNKYKEARRNARAQEKTRQELVNELECTAGNECLQGCKANGKIQAGCSRSKLCVRCKW